MKLFYRKTGHGPLIIILHGLFGSSDNWMSIAKKLSTTYSVILPDLRNHGQSPHEELFTYDAMVDDLKELVETEDLGNFILAGHSMGGKVAMQYAVQYPGNVQKLIVVDIAPKDYPVHHQLILEGLCALPIDQIKSRNEADALLSNQVPDAGVRQFLLKNLKRKEDGFSWKMNLEVIEDNIDQVGVGLDQSVVSYVPALFIRGANSNYILDEDRVGIFRHFPKASIEDVAGASHWVHAEKPDDVVNLFLNFGANP